MCETASGEAVRAEVLLMSGGKMTERGFLYDEPDMNYPEAMRPLSTAQNIHTTLITCPLRQVNAKKTDHPPSSGCSHIGPMAVAPSALSTTKLGRDGLGRAERRAVSAGSRLPKLTSRFSLGIHPITILQLLGLGHRRYSALSATHIAVLTNRIGRQRPSAWKRVHSRFQVH